MNSLRITVLVENTTRRPGLLAEHGLAFWIEVGSRKVLFDTGQSDVLCLNINHLGIDAEKLEGIILSHGHYDHTGGLGPFLMDHEYVPIFAHPDAFGDKYTQKGDGEIRNIGLPSRSRTALQKSGGIKQTNTAMEICEGLSVTGPVPRLTDFENTGGAFFKDAGCFRPDELLDDQAVFIDTCEGIVVVLGCAHSGIINTLRYIQELVPKRPIHAVIGGMHLGSADDKRMAQTVEGLRELNVRYLYPMHCTGFEATARFWRDFPDRVMICSTGSTLEF